MDNAILIFIVVLFAFYGLFTEKSTYGDLIKNYVSFFKNGFQLTVLFTIIGYITAFVASKSTTLKALTASQKTELTDKINHYDASQWLSIAKQARFVQFLCLFILLYLLRNLLKTNRFKQLDFIQTILTWILRLYPIISLFFLMGRLSAVKQAFTGDLQNFTIMISIALIVGFLGQLLYLKSKGIQILEFLKESIFCLITAFISSSSFMTLPATVDVLVDKFKMKKDQALLDSVSGLAIWQNACAGFFATFILTLSHAAAGDSILNLFFFIKVIFFVLVFALVGCLLGGGATTVTVLAGLALGVSPTYLIILAGIEGYVDAVRTTLNVNGVLVSAKIASKEE